MLRVLVATPLGHGGRGGIDRLMDAVAAELLKSKPAGVEVEFMPTRGPGSILASPIHLARFLIALTARKVANRIDLVHVNLSSHGSTYRKLLICAWARILRIPYTLHLHGSDYRQFFEQCSPTLRGAIRAMHERASVNFVLGSVWQQFIIGIAPKSKTVILPNATRAQPELVSRPPNPERILFLGRIGQRKGVPDLINALRLIADSPDWTCLIAGDGEYKAAVDAIRQFQLEARVTVRNWLAPAEVEEELAKATILALPSFDENLPMSVIEGMSAGLAVVTTPVGATPDIIRHGETGLLVHPGDVTALAEALRTLISHPELRLSLGANARSFHRQNLELRGYVRRLVDQWDLAARASQGR